MSDSQRETSAGDIWEQTGELWESEGVARTGVPKFTGNLYTIKYMANMDAKGLGPERIRCGRKTVYVKKSLISWLQQRTKTC